jgi:hypothetical protein
LAALRPAEMGALNVVADAVWLRNAARDTKGIF